MVDLEIRNLDELTADVLRARSEQRGISLEEEVRRTLSESVASDMRAFSRRAAALRAAAGGMPDDPELDSARIIRKARDAWR
jgi:plasmid stability protein